MKYLQLHPDGTIRAVHPGKPYAPPDGDYLEVEDSEVPADLHQYSVQDGKLALRPQAEYDAVLASRAKKSEAQLLREEIDALKGRANALERSTTDLTTKANDLESRTATLETAKVPPLESKTSELDGRTKTLEQEVAALQPTP